MRLRYIDFTKGLAIILMIFGHTMSKINCLHIWIYSFHMPIFFIICGIIMCRKGRQKSYSLLKEKIIRRWYTLGIPYLFFGGVLILFYTILDLLDGQPISFFSRLLRVITFQGIDALWFIPVYCFSEIIMKIIYKYKWRDIIISFVFLIICISTKSTIHIGSTIYKIMLGICFVEIGILIEQYLIIEKLVQKFLNKWTIFLFCSILFSSNQKEH